MSDTAHLSRMNFDWAEEVVANGLASLKRLNGYYHDNFVAYHSGKSYLIRIKKEEAGEMDPRQFEENLVLQKLEQINFPSPRFLYENKARGFSVHSFIDGQVGSALYPDSVPLSTGLMQDLAELFARLHCQQIDGLSVPYQDTRGFYLYLMDFLQTLYLRVWGESPELYDKYDFPADPIEPLRKLGEKITARPLKLCHGDMHKHNFMITPDQKIVMLDWELALQGDEYFDLAVHAHRSGYDDEQINLFLSRYLKERGQLDSYQQMRAQFDVYIAFERVKSAIVDVKRVYDHEMHPVAGLLTENPLKTNLPNTLTRAQKVWAQG